MQVPTVFDRVALSAALVHGPVARIVVATVHGSAPREAGAAMLVWADGQSGTIGGGALEFQAVARARKMLADAASTAPVPSPQGARAAPALPTGPHDRGPDAGPTPVLCASPPPCGEGIGAEGAPQAVAVDRIALGPALNQCCGGAVTLWTELWTSVPDGPVIARGPGRMPLAVARTLDRARSRGQAPATALIDGWLVESVAMPRRHLWVWGAGHVGRAIVVTMAPLPGLAITWADVGRDRFPATLPAGVDVIVRPDLALAVADAPALAEHLVLTFSHALDLELCHRLLIHGFAACGLIGSASKAARFRSRLSALGHGPASIARIRCPIGDPGLGKHPQAIAIGVASAFLSPIAAARGAATA
jgi:xanthine dehydrogenase accessory factor